MFNRFLRLLLTLAIASGVGWWPQFSLASPEQPTREELELELQNIERQIAEYEAELKQTTSAKQKLAAKIKQLKTEQTILKLKIQSTTVALKRLERKLDNTEVAIAKNQRKTDTLKRQLALLLRLLQQQEERVLLTLLSENGLAGAFNYLASHVKLSGAVAEVITKLKDTKQELERKQAELTDAQEENQHLLSIQTIQHQALRGRLSEESDLLEETKGKESAYQALLTEQRRRATAIRNRIYEVLGVATQISFGEAVKISQWVSGLTGVRPAFLLAILTQESNLGKNVGTCNRASDPPEKGWRQVMKPERDQEPFRQITSELGLDPDTTPVSCPMKDRRGRRIGWGGAMGPAQFIPSTWMGYKDKVSAITGKNPANPWDIRDAFVAAGVKLKAGGANGSREAEWKAAMRYFSGSTNPRFRFYGDNVLKLADRYEDDIKTLQ